ISGGGEDRPGPAGGVATRPGGKAMKVPFELRRLPGPEPARALLLPGHEGQPLLDFCARLRQDPLPPIFTVSEGFLLKLCQPTSLPLPGVIRLRALADNLFVPCDAELVPGLHDDERPAWSSNVGSCSCRAGASWPSTRTNRCPCPSCCASRRS